MAGKNAPGNRGQVVWRHAVGRVEQKIVSTVSESDNTVSDFTILSSGIYLEGLAVDDRRNVIWYSDVIGGGIHGLMPDGTITSFNADRMWTGGVMINADGSVLSSGEGGIMWNNPETGTSGWLIHEIDGEVINGINEMSPDGQGGLVFGTCDIERVKIGGTPRPTSIYRLTVEGEVKKLADEIGFCNGLMYDQIRRKLYCNDTFNRCWVFDVTPEFILSNKQVFLEKDDVDGMALDAEGNVWITGFRSSFVTRVRPDGVELSPLKTPAEAITQVRFGGADMRDLYVNAVPTDGGDSLKNGEIPTNENSFLYRTRSENAGMPIETTKFRLS